jgi:D-alanyl-D-alanine carboxypeptidase
MARKLDGIGLATVGVGVIFAYAGLTGKSVLASAQSVIRGTSPVGLGKANPIVGQDSAPAPSAEFGGGNLPALNSTLPPEATMVRIFGPKNDPSQETRVPFAGKSVQVNKVLAGVVQQIGNQIAAAGFSSYIRDVGGFRTSIGASGSPIPYSMHQFGAAIDINEDGGPNGNWNTMTLPRPIVNAFTSHGWICGESWSGASRDGGHFQYMGG